MTIRHEQHEVFHTGSSTCGTRAVMLVATVNSGSTSVKLAAYELADQRAPGRIARESHSVEKLAERELLERFLEQLPRKPDVVAHRVVHGGTRFSRPVRIDASVLAEIAHLSELAPLHNPPALRWIGAAGDLCGPATVQVAAFDTAFFAELPRVASEYAIAPRLAVEHGVRRYGFHGLAHEAMLRRWQESHPGSPLGGRLITLQLGGGCSITAIAAGRPVDTSMGFSPLEGLVMATRSGDIDPAVVPYLQRRLARSGDEIVELLNREAGLRGLSEGSADLSALLSTGDSRAEFALDLYCYRARKYIGAYLAVLGGCDGIVFGGGVGEHVPAVRARILDGMQWAGIELDARANVAAVGREARIDGPQSRIEIHVIPIDEERMLTAAARSVLAAQ